MGFESPHIKNIKTSELLDIYRILSDISKALSKIDMDCTMETLLQG